MQNKFDSAKTRLDVEAQQCTWYSFKKEGLEKVGFVKTESKKVKVDLKTSVTVQHYFVQDAMPNRVIMY